jgi:hypothetical protein
VATRDAEERQQRVDARARSRGEGGGEESRGEKNHRAVARRVRI